MTDFEKVKYYYSIFDEWGRLDTPEGKLEFELTMSVITSHLSQNAEILDLGGGAGQVHDRTCQIGTFTAFGGLVTGIA